jgi:2-(1,2-epoxy-1,2-dihydrophenyl)acetyl-CoA isomerase
MAEALLLEKNGAVASITFNRPDRANAMDTAWLPAMTEFLRDAGRDPAIRCVLIRGNGKHFMAGGDLEMLGRFAALPAEQRATQADGPITLCNAMIAVMRSLGKPIVASVQGGVAGSAVGLVAACDLAVAADNAFFLLAHVSLGITNDGMTSYFLPRQLGMRKTLELALLGDRISAADAKQANLVNFVVPAAELEAATSKLLARLSAGPTRTYGLIKSLVQASLDNSLERQGQLELECYRQAAVSNDYVEGINSVLGKRAPNFTGT